MKKMHVLVLGLIFVIILSAVGCGSPAQAPAPTATEGVHAGKVLLETRCSTCHGLNMVEASKKDLDGWQATVDRMILVGAQLNDEQKVQVVDYLVINYGK
jgi:mono/diheme cytochrome c family protein